MSSATATFPFHQEVEDAIRRTGNRLRTRVGYDPKKRRHIPIQPVIAAQIMAGLDNRTIDFDPTSPESRDKEIRTIYEFLAFNYPIDKAYSLIDRPNTAQRFRSKDRDARVMKSAFRAFQKHIAKDNFTLPLLMVSRNPDGARIEVITFNRDYEVMKGVTAGSIALARQKVRCKAHTQSMLTNNASLDGETAFKRVKAELKKFIDDCQYGKLIQPLLTFSEEQAAIEA